MTLYACCARRFPRRRTTSRVPTLSKHWPVHSATRPSGWTRSFGACAPRWHRPNNWPLNCGRDESTPEEATYWAGQIESQVASWIALVERYLSWVELLDHEIDGVADLGDPDTHAALLLSLAQAPSLGELAAGKCASLNTVMEHYSTDNDNPQSLGHRVAALKDAMAKAQWLAGETLAQAKETMHEMRALGKGMGMGFLYDAQSASLTSGIT